MTPAEYAHSYAANPVERVRLEAAFTEAMEEARTAAVQCERAAQNAHGDFVKRATQHVTNPNAIRLLAAVFAAIGAERDRVWADEVRHLLCDTGWQATGKLRALIEGE